jgi:hypothetical protein
MAIRYKPEAITGTVGPRMVEAIDRNFDVLFEDARTLLANIITGEVPAGLINGANASFRLAHTPLAGSPRLFVNGERQVLGTDYTISGKAITMISIPAIGETFIVDYWIA